MYQESDLITPYLESLNAKEKKGYEIARDHLGMSYQVEKSIGFQTFCKKQKAEREQKEKEEEERKAATPSAA